MKTRFMMSTEVTETKQFKSMSPWAQLLYQRCCANTNTYGHVDAESICFGMRCDEDVLDELYENGYLIEVNGMTYIRHHWVNNNYKASDFIKMENCVAYTTGALRFEGKPGYTPYVIPAKGDGEEGVFDNDGKTPVGNVENFLTARETDSVSDREPNTNIIESNVMEGNGAAPTKAKGASKPKNGKQAYPIETTGLCEVCCREGAVYRDWGASKEIICKYCGTLVYDEKEGVYKRRGNERGVLGALNDDMTEQRAKGGLFRVVNF